MDEKETNKLRFDKIWFILQASNLVPYLTLKDQVKLVDKFSKRKINDEIELRKYFKFIDKYISKIDEYIKYLKENFEVIDLPEFVILSNFDMATKVFREYQFQLIQMKLGW